MMGLEPTIFCMANRPEMVMLSLDRCVVAFLASLSSGWIRLSEDKLPDKERWLFRKREPRYTNPNDGLVRSVRARVLAR